MMVLTGSGQSCIDGEDALGHQEPPARGRDDEGGHVTGIAEGCAEGGSCATFAGSPASMRWRIVTGADVPFAAAASIAARTMKYPLRADRARCPRAAPASPGPSRPDGNAHRDDQANLRSVQASAVHLHEPWVHARERISPLSGATCTASSKRHPSASRCPHSCSTAPSASTGM